MDGDSKILDNDSFNVCYRHLQWVFLLPNWLAEYLLIVKIVPPGVQISLTIISIIDLNVVWNTSG